MSPPPAIENAFELAMARASASVPLLKASNSNTPTGPFQTTVPALSISCAYCAAVCGADVEDQVVFGDGVDRLHFGNGIRHELLGGDHVDRQRDVSATRLGVATIFFAVSSRSGSYSDLPTL